MTTKSKPQKPDGTERSRDEAREGGGPRYGGGPWEVADERGDQRFGHARNDDADPLTMVRRDEENDDENTDDDESANTADPEVAAEEAAGKIVSGGQHEGFGRAEKPRKNKDRS